MGTSLEVFVEFDDSGGQRPFEQPPTGVLFFDRYIALAEGKDEVLISMLREATIGTGLPPNASNDIRKEIVELFDPSLESVRWTTYASLQRVIPDPEVGGLSPGLAGRALLRVLRFLAQQLGPDRVRVINGIH